jgi:hypothetical protein
VNSGAQWLPFGLSQTRMNLVRLYRPKQGIDLFVLNFNIINWRQKSMLNLIHCRQVSINFVIPTVKSYNINLNTGLIYKTYKLLTQILSFRDSRKHHRLDVFSIIIKRLLIKLFTASFLWLSSILMINFNHEMSCHRHLNKYRTIRDRSFNF